MRSYSRHPRRGLRLASLSALLLVVALVALVGCKKDDERVFRRTPQELVGETFPEVTIRHSEEGNTTLSAPEGPAIVSIWATWCVPCREEVPVLKAWADEHPDVELVFINADEDGVSDEDIALSAEELGVPAPYLRLRGRMMGVLGVRALPTLFLIGATGDVASVEEGYLGADGLRLLLGEWVDAGYGLE